MLASNNLCVPSVACYRTCDTRVLRGALPCLTSLLLPLLLRTADGVSSLLSALAGSLPLTTFAQARTGFGSSACWGCRWGLGGAACLDVDVPTRLFVAW